MPSQLESVLQSSARNTAALRYGTSLAIIRCPGMTLRALTKVMMTLAPSRAHPGRVWPIALVPRVHIASRPLHSVRGTLQQLSTTDGWFHTIVKSE